MFFAAVLLASCAKENKQIDYASLKSKSFSSLSFVERESFIDQLSAKLKDDKDFLEYNKSLTNMMKIYFDRDRSVVKKLSGSIPKNLDERLSYYKQAGVKDPKELVRNQMNTVIYYANVRKKYPELKGMDKQTTSLIFKNAGGKMSKADKKAILVAMKKDMENAKL